MLAADWLVNGFKCFQSNNLKMGLEKNQDELEAIPDISYSVFERVPTETSVTWISINGLNSHSEIIMTHEAKKKKEKQIMHQI